MEPSAYAELRYRDGLECARRATHFDQEGHFSAAMSLYSETVEALREACSLAPLFSPILPRVNEYARRAEEIRQYLGTRKEDSGPVTQATGHSDKEQRYMRQIEYLLEMAMLDDEAGQKGEAEKLYTCAIDFALKAKEYLRSEADKSKVKVITTEALKRLEELKLEKEESAPSALPLEKLLDQMPSPPMDEPSVPIGGRRSPVPGGRRSPVPKPAHRPYRGPLISFQDADPDLTKAPKFNAFGSSSSQPKAPRGGPTSSGGAGPPAASVGGKRHKGAMFTEAELLVLRATSVINGVTYLPWSDADLVELRTVSSLPQDFKDPAGLPRLADKQKAQLAGWFRPHDICDNPKMVHLISSFTIKQSIIGDCSFIASLAVSADYEKRFKTRLVTRCIYPQNRLGEPIINPNGKYMVCLNLNGCRRKVLIDDRLPMGHHGEFLCSYSSNRDEFWISLIEKAYMKVMGGYDFPGSSSNIDLHALTGWIPERIGIKDSAEFLFKKMETSLKRGNALITVATGQMSDAVTERAGLVPAHAYAVLRVEEIKGLRLLQLKNPWSHKRWKGNYSENDRTHWTPELRKALNFDQMQALQVDNGVFWIDWKSLCNFFDVVYLNWRPSLFKHKSTLHDVWKVGDVEKDWYNISNNPQYILRVQCSDQSATIWVLLSRHITTKNDFAHNEKFITLNIAKSDGKRIFYPDKFLVQGIKINTPHYLAKLENVPQGSSTYTIIVSQLESLSTIHYTLKVYSTCEFSLTPVPNPYKHSKKLKGDWRPGQRSPPKFILTTSSVSSHVMVKLQAPKELFVRVDMAAESPGTEFQRVDSGPLRPGFVVLETSSVPRGSFGVYPVTYSPPAGKSIPFFITLFSDNVFNFEPSRQ